MMEYKLSEICILKSGGTPRRGHPEYYDGDIPWVKISDFKKNKTGILLDTEEKITQKGLESINNRLFEKGTLLLAMYGSVGKVIITGIKASCNQAILGITPKDKSILNLNYLKYWLQINKERLVNQGRGVTLNNISATIVKKQVINLLDLPTQNKIVALLDKASALVQKRENSIAQLDELLRAQFLEMFGDPVLNPKGWKINKFIDLCTKITDGTHKTPKYKNEGVPFISAKNLKGNKIYWDNIKYVSEEESAFINKRCNVEKGDVLLTKSGSLGQPAIIDVDFKFSVFESLALIKYKRDRLNNSFLLAFLESETVLFLYKRRTKGVAVKHLHLVDIKSIPIITPPIELQNEFEVIYHNIHVQKETLTQSKLELENLYHSLLQRAFSRQLI